MVTLRRHVNGAIAEVERLPDGTYVAWETLANGGTRPVRFLATALGLGLAKLIADRTAHPGGCRGLDCGSWTLFLDYPDSDAIRAASLRPSVPVAFG